MWGPAGPIKNYPTFSLSFKNPWVSYHQVTPIRDPFITADLLGRPPFLKGSPATSPLKRSQKCRIFSEVQRCRWTAYSGSQCPYPYHPMGTRKSIYGHIDPTKINHSCIGKYTIVPRIVWVMSLGHMVMLDSRCWIVPLGSGKTLGFCKGRFTLFWCCLLIYIFWCEKSTWLPISVFPTSLEGTSARISQEIRKFFATALFQPLMNWGIS